GEIVGGALEAARKNIRIGVTTLELDSLIEDYIRSHGGTPSFKGYGRQDNPFPNAACISINEIVVHGIPSERKLEEGDIVSIDVGVYYSGYHSDAARTYAVGRIDPEKQRLIDVARQSFYTGIEYFGIGNRVRDISSAIQQYVESNGFHVVRALVGHGIGKNLHEQPDVPNFGRPGTGVRLENGMTLAIEPMIAMGTYEVYEKDDGWAISTRDHSPAAHYENTVALIDNKPVIFTPGGE
ncbi:MAG TPA: type I methionyl aminopeptidase, partial [Clostridia bacterium]|nr:type I methionyl aminopeptidase [Clostridia bacterium]